MCSQSQKTFEELILEQHPEVQQALKESESFQLWKEQLPTIEVDDVTLYVRAGDMLQDEAQVAFDWAYEAGLLTEAEVEATAREHSAVLGSSGELEFTELK